jgi:hypothetical protein
LAIGFRRRRRRAQPGLGPDARLAAIDGRIEQIGQRRRDRRQSLAGGLGAGRPRRVLPLSRRLGFVGGLRHRMNMDRRRPRGKGGSDQPKLPDRTEFFEASPDRFLTKD